MEKIEVVPNPSLALQAPMRVNSSEIPTSGTSHVSLWRRCSCTSFSSIAVPNPAFSEG